MVAAFPDMEQGAPLEHEPIAAPEPLKRTALEAAIVTLSAEYVPAVTETFVATTSESDCRRVSSKLAGELGPKSDTALPPAEGVKVIPMIGEVKLMIEVLAGAESEMDRLTDALPPQLPPGHVTTFLGPLQEATARVARRIANERAFLRFIGYPTMHHCAFS